MSSSIVKHPVFLCGMMGSGKTTIGKQLARVIDKPFQDLDAVIEESEGMSIPEIFEQKGEKHFREIERKQLVKLAAKLDGVLALGGGSLQNQQIVDHLKIYGWLIFIDVPVDEIVDRLQDSSGRPMLEDTDKLKDRIESLFDERMQFYTQSHFTIQTGNRSIDQIITEIEKKLTIYEGRNYR